MKRVVCWFMNKVRDIARGYSDADIESMRRKLDSGKNEFTHREHTAYVCEVQESRDDQVL
jgi:hypothetical protein